MTLPLEVYKAKSFHGALAKAHETALTVIASWLKYGLDKGGHEKDAHAAVVGWQGVDLAERITRALLEAQGFDLDLFEMEYEACVNDSERADVCAMFETLAKEEKKETEPR